MVNPPQTGGFFLPDGSANWEDELGGQIGKTNWEGEAPAELIIYIQVLTIFGHYGLIYRFPDSFD